jgi:hypothetical protein
MQFIPTQSTADALSRQFPSRITVTWRDCTWSACGLLALAVQFTQWGDNESDVIDMLPVIGLAYSGGCSGDFDADLPHLRKTQATAKAQHTVSQICRSLVEDGYKLAAGRASAIK